LRFDRIYDILSDRINFEEEIEMHVKYDTKGICAVRVEFDVEDGVVKNISFLGGCDGNHKALAALAEGMTPEEAAKRLKGITCGRRNTSCPDQLAVALEEFMKNQ
jgi:uncharacterized protein (TIGR03905 family)